MKKQESTKAERKNDWASNGLQLLKGGVVGCVLATGMLFLCALLVSKGIVQEPYMDGCTLLSCVMGAVVGGFVAVRSIATRQLPVGLGVGLVQSILLFLMGVLVFGGVSTEWNGLRIACACLCGGAIAGVLTRKPKKNKRR